MRDGGCPLWFWRCPWRPLLWRCGAALASPCGGCGNTVDGDGDLDLLVLVYYFGSVLVINKGASFVDEVGCDSRGSPRYPVPSVALPRRRCDCSACVLLYGLMQTAARGLTYFLPTYVMTGSCFLDADGDGDCKWLPSVCPICRCEYEQRLALEHCEAWELRPGGSSRWWVGRGEGLPAL
jgi:hypothetical protein